MKANPVTDSSCNDQLLYFTSSSLTKDNKTLIFISDRTGNPNIFAKDLATGLERQLTLNQEGTLKSYVYFYGSSEKGLGKASISFDAKRGIVYYIQGKDICCTDLDGNVRKLNQLPAGQVTAFTAISTNGKKLCVPTTDERALDTGNTSSNNITDNPDYDVDARVQNEHLNSYLRVYDTATGEETLCEKVEHAWITHVQFCPTDPNLILYNHEWPADCGCLTERITAVYGRKEKDSEKRIGPAMKCGSPTANISSTTENIRTKPHILEGSASPAMTIVKSH